MSLNELKKRLRQLRYQAMEADYPSPELEAIYAQMDEVDNQIAKLKAQKPEPVGFYSGLTRRELAATGTCETDWF